ncbi:MAG TPA: YceI family protein [Ferruginibacter sp.]|jgi:polyisoprenoid-binding protein YceI|nr:YceI family protein [Ferruginibacter sp.]
MKKYLLFLLVVLTTNLAIAQYKPVDKGSSIKFEIKNFGINTGGSFTGLRGDISFDKDHPEDSKFIVSIDANTINTDNSARDNHLREESYFDVKKYPRINFVSTRISKSASGELTIYGKLTIKDQTKDISFPFTATASNDGYLFKGSFNINRKDFGVGGSSTISNNLEVQLTMLAAK